MQKLLNERFMECREAGKLCKILASSFCLKKRMHVHKNLTYDIAGFFCFLKFFVWINTRSIATKRS